MIEVISIDNEIIKLKELGLIHAEVNDQSKIGEILKSFVRSFDEFRRKFKCKEVCSSSELVSNAMNSMMKPDPGMLVGSNSYLDIYMILMKRNNKNFMTKEYQKGKEMVTNVHIKSGR